MNCKVMTENNYFVMEKDDNMKYSEDTLKTWCNPLSETENSKAENVIRMIKTAISKSTDLSDLDIEIFLQGSYPNNTNVRINSDVDVCIMLTSTVFVEYPDGKTKEDYDYTDGTISYSDYKNLVLDALQDEFGSSSVIIGNKSFKIPSNSYRIGADAVAAFQLRDYKSINSTNSTNYLEGIRFYSKDGKEITNYPKVHIQNGINKNNRTNYAYKKLVRIMKRIRNEMADDNLINDEVITSFLVECLVWNTPDSIIMNYSTWTETVRQTIAHIYNSINEDTHKNWGEVSERFYLFHSGRKWTDTGAKNFIQSAWNYLGYAND